MEVMDTIRLKMRMSGSAELVAVANALSCYHVVETERVPTAATDGVVMAFNPVFMAEMGFKEQCGVIAHELMHPRLNHHNRGTVAIARGMDDMTAQNQAMDSEINPLLFQAGFKLPDGCCHPDEVGMETGLPWESYYPAYAKGSDEYVEPDEPDESGEPDEQAGSPCSGESGESGESSNAEQSDGESDSDGESNASGDADSDSEGDGSESESNAESDGSDEQDADGESGGGDGSGDESGDGSAAPSIGDGVHPSGTLAEQFCPEVVKAEQAKNARRAERAMKGTDLEREVVEVLEAAAKLAGELDVLEEAKCEILLPSHDEERWQDLVVETFRRGDTMTIDWSKRGRRSGIGGVYHAGVRRTNGVTVALVLDISGSCASYLRLWEELANELVDEIHAVKKIELLYHNRHLTAHETWMRGQGEVEIKQVSGGGTCHKEVLGAVEKLDVDVVLQFTDCATRWPDQFPKADFVTILPEAPSYSGDLADDACPVGINIPIYKFPAEAGKGRC